jgi:PIN domain nuclease of toxin-antitoxin system
MRLLIDTHIFLWFVLNDASLSPIARELIVDPQNDIFLSPASYWELAIKISLGKYQIPGSFEFWMNHQIQSNEFLILPIEIAHAAMVIQLPFHHKDPFDRILISQALVETIPIVSADAVFDSYGVTRLW